MKRLSAALKADGSAALSETCVSNRNVMRMRAEQSIVWDLCRRASGGWIPLRACKSICRMADEIHG